MSFNDIDKARFPRVAKRGSARNKDARLHVETPEPTHVPANPFHHTAEDGTMGFFSQDIKNMDDLFVHTLRDIYYAEKQIVQALPDMIEKARDPQLKQAFQSHLGETKNHV